MAWRVVVEPQFHSATSQLHIANAGQGTWDLAHPMTFTSVQHGLIPPPELVALTLPGNEMTDFLQAMMDAAWDAGVRPSRGQNDSDLRAHLKDMRAIAFKGIKAEPPH